MNHLALTIDVDWAPDCAIDFVAEALIRRGVRATWFLTHGSAAIDRLQRFPEYFELGIHPNFLPGSSHGENTEAVLRHCLRLVPGARSMRTHALVQSTPLLRQIAAETPITTDVSLFLPYTPALRPVEFRWPTGALLRIPYLWADDLALEPGYGSWRLGPLLSLGSGLKVLAFHPIHVYLNSASMDLYGKLKANVSDVRRALPEDLHRYRHAGAGTRSLFNEVVDHMSARGSLTISEIHSRWIQRDESRRDCRIDIQ